MKRDSTSDRLQRSPIHLLHRAGQCAGDIFHAEMMHGELTPRQFAVLYTVANNEGLSQTGRIDDVRHVLAVLREHTNDPQPVRVAEGAKQAGDGLNGLLHINLHKYQSQCISPCGAVNPQDRKVLAQLFS